MNQKKNLSLFKVFMSDDVFSPLQDVLKSGYLTEGPQVEKFESELKNYIGNENLLTINSATSGLTLALRLLMDEDKDSEWPGFNIKTDVVLTPTLTCFATTTSILANRCNINWIDTDNTTANISIDDVAKKLTMNTKVLFLVHWGGYPVDLDKIKQLQEIHYQKYGYRFKVVEDCAHAFGATFKGKKLGNHDNICVYSFQAIKTLTAGDGGIIVLPTKKLYERCKLLRWFGIDRNKRNYNRKDLRMEHDIEEWGYKFHMNDINATIGLHNLPHVDRLLEKNRRNNQLLFSGLKDINGITLLENKDDRETSAWLFTMRVARKSDFIEKMKSKGIATSQVHNRNDQNSCVFPFRCELPNIDRLEQDLICLPVGWWIEEDDIQYIIDSIKEDW